MVVGCPCILMLYRPQLFGPRFPPVSLLVFNDLACILCTQFDENRPIMGLPVPPSNKPGTRSSRVGLEFTSTPVSEPTASLSRARPSYPALGSFTQPEFCLEDSSTPAINCTPSTPSFTPGTSSDDAIGVRSSVRAAICSAKSA